MTYRVVVATALSQAGLELLRAEVGGLAQTITPDQARNHPALATAEALIIRDELEVDRAMLDAMPRLRVIGRAGVGIAGIDIEEATRRGIVVMNTPGINAISVAEYSFALLLALARHIVTAHTALGTGGWDRNSLLGIELHRKTLGLIGMGRVGREVAKRALAFGMRVLAYDPYVMEGQLQGLQIKLVGLTELLSSADVISIHSAVTPETRQLLNLETLALLKPGALLVNTAHGSIIDEAALLTMLNNGRLAGAALDVFAHEPVHDSRLINHPKVLHTPHLGDSTYEAQRDLGLIITQQVLDALHGEDYRNVVNMPVVDGTSFEALAPYLKLAEAIGTLQHHLANGPIQRVMLEFKGQEFQHLVKPMTVALLRGLLTPVLGRDHVNYINAPILAHERNIFVTQAKGLDSTDYANLLSCQSEYATGKLIIAGALFNQTDPHIVLVDQYRADFIPQGVLLIIGSYDIPGVIGRVGLLLAENNINIADWRTGRAERGGHTLSIATLDEPIPDAVIETLLAQDYIRHARQIVFA